MEGRNMDLNVMEKNRSRMNCLGERDKTGRIFVVGQSENPHHDLTSMVSSVKIGIERCRKLQYFSPPFSLFTCSLAFHSLVLIFSPPC